MRALAVIVLLWATAAVAQPVVEVSYDKAAPFTDAGEGPREVEANIAALTQHLQRLVESRFVTGQQLRIEIVELDLAGQLIPTGRAAQRTRVINGAADWPRIDLRYELSSPAGVVSRGVESLSDKSYLLHSLPGSDEALRYEQRLLTQWFNTRFGAAAGTTP